MNAEEKENVFISVNATNSRLKKRSKTNEKDFLFTWFDDVTTIVDWLS